MSHSTVLIADDNSEWQTNIARILGAEYAVLAFVARGDEVVATAMILQPEVVTLDVSMPGVSGLNLLPELRAALPGAVIVIVTTTSNKLYIDEAYQRGANGYVLKRKALSDLVPAIQNCVLQNSWRHMREA